ncbi:unnamed protein product [Cladocopium goreaui]|uniref:Ribonuclease n=1 Tax=Cladocopium goreaui TaxID=2562237 RepID=A0A9P1C259_9DINO|nr:unnamed protein product [Cladocopium goreaui]
MGCVQRDKDVGSVGSVGLDSWERPLWRETRVVCGVDEAGRGPLAGPVLELLSRVNDSKQLAEQQREELYQELTDEKFLHRTVWAVAESSAADIDACNILQASLSAMARAVEALKVPDQELHVLVDGCNRPPELLADGEKWTRMSQRDIEAAKNQRKLSQFFSKKSKSEKSELGEMETDDMKDMKDVDVKHVKRCRPKKVDAVIEGDGRVPSISAASIIAKVHRDRLMEGLDKEYPAYGFKAHKGYGTEAHMQAIREHGVCIEHRKSFAPIRQALEKQSDISAFGAATNATSATSSKPKKTPSKGTKKTGLKAKG